MNGIKLSYEKYNVIVENRERGMYIEFYSKKDGMSLYEYYDGAVFYTLDNERPVPPSTDVYDIIEQLTGKPF